MKMRKPYIQARRNGNRRTVNHPGAFVTHPTPIAVGQLAARIGVGGVRVSMLVVRDRIDSPNAPGGSPGS